MISLADSHINQLPPNLISWEGYGWITATCAAIAWLIDNRRKATEIGKLKAEETKLKAEVNKLKIEEIKLAGDSLKELQRVRDLYADACVKCTQATTKLSSCLKDGSSDQAVINARNELCEVVTRSALQSLCSLVEWNCLTRKHNPESVTTYVQNSVIFDLKQITEWVEVINMDMFIQRYSASPLVISPQNLSPISNIDRFMSADDITWLSPLLQNAINKLTDS